ncbi:MAG: 50S ribosomal protein L11 methyltransferase [Methanobacteriaceae archaeon]|nr:50S ribosomal protein L11 methyltransferase [Methanobacteriaceae archaeon]
MVLSCTCGKNCINISSDVLHNIHSFYKPCNQCSDFQLKKFKPLQEQIPLEKIDKNWGKCECGKRHMDVVMAHILKIMIEEGIKPIKSTLRMVGTPLITPGYPTPHIPYLPKKSLIIVDKEINKKCAERLFYEVKEIKGVLKGDPKKTVGIKDFNSESYSYELLMGCDMRCDIVSYPKGDICIYKNQKEIHIEFSRSQSPKIEKIMRAQIKYDSPSLLDSTCGPGTLGIAALKLGAQKVVFNDIWPPAVEMTLLNLEVNGFTVESVKDQNEIISSKKSDKLIASGEKFEVYCMDVRNLAKVLKQKFDIGIVDTFPGVKNHEIVESLTGLCHEVIVI